MQIATRQGLKSTSPQKAAVEDEPKPNIDPYLLNHEFVSTADRLIQLLHNYHVNIKGDSHDRTTVLKEASAILETRA